MPTVSVPAVIVVPWSIVHAPVRLSVPAPSLVRVVPAPPKPVPSTTLLPFVSRRIAWLSAVLKRAEKSVPALAALYWSVPPPKERVPLEPRAPALPTLSVPALRFVPPV